MPISAAVNAYASIYKAKAKKFTLDLGGKLYYSDTDSIITYIEMPKDWVSPYEIGN